MSSSYEWKKLENSDGGLILTIGGGNQERSDFAHQLMLSTIIGGDLAFEWGVRQGPVAIVAWEEHIEIIREKLIRFIELAEAEAEALWVPDYDTDIRVNIIAVPHILPKDPIWVGGNEVTLVVVNPLSLDCFGGCWAEWDKLAVTIARRWRGAEIFDAGYPADDPWTMTIETMFEAEARLFGFPEQERRQCIRKQVIKNDRALTWWEKEGEVIKLVPR